MELYIIQNKTPVENREKNAEVQIGIAPLAANAPICVDPDKLFGRHLAILGNTGSGKSCSVAGLIRWSLQTAKEFSQKNNKPLNSRFIILDPNGEYSDLFDDIDKPVRKYKIKLDEENDDKQLKIPAWMWNSHEWISFSQAAPGAQRPLLLQALTDIKRGTTVSESLKIRVHSFLSSRKSLFKSYIVDIPNAEVNFPRFSGFTDSLEKFVNDLEFYEHAINIENEILEALASIKETVKELLRLRLLRRANGEIYKDANGNTRYTTFTNHDLENILVSINNVINSLNISTTSISDINPDTPIKFNIDKLTPHLLQLAEAQDGNMVQFVHMLSLRMRFLVADERLKTVVNPAEEISLENWLNEFIGKDKADNGQIAIIDLSLIPSVVVHIIIAVFSRLVFEAIQRFRRMNHKELPTVLILEEAHTFIRDNRFDGTRYSQLCQDVFERIAREGRKFGLSLVLSSQRPSELSPTVLSQCNTFLLHRIVNDKDQDLVRRLVPDNIGALLKELPVLPTRKAIILGWASPIPILVEMRELEEKYRPHSNDPEFWDVGVGNQDRNIDWSIIANDWQGTEGSVEENNDPNESFNNNETQEEDLPF